MRVLTTVAIVKRECHDRRVYSDRTDSPQVGTPVSTMAKTLQSLFHAIDTATDEATLRHRLMDDLGEFFGVQRWGIYLINSDQTLASMDAHGVSESFVERYQQYGKSVDPVLKYVIENHAPAHEEMVLPMGTWKQSELFQRCCSHYNHEHIMTGPIVGEGGLIGTINFARIGHTPGFDAQDVARLGAVGTHLSARLASLRVGGSDNPWRQKLTDRELQIAELVAKGLTNTEIGVELWITQNSVKQALKRMFRKVQVSARTELVAKLRA